MHDKRLRGTQVGRAQAAAMRQFARFPRGAERHGHQVIYVCDHGMLELRRGQRMRIAGRFKVTDQQFERGDCRPECVAPRRRRDQ